MVARRVGGDFGLFTNSDTDTFVATNTDMAPEGSPPSCYVQRPLLSSPLPRPGDPPSPASGQGEVSRTQILHIRVEEAWT